MSVYKRISVRMWGDAKFRSLSAAAPNAQTLWIYLLTGEHTTTIPGVVRAGEATLAESLGWPIPAFRKAFAEIYAKGMAQPDWSSRLVFLPKALVHNPPQSPKVVIAWRKAFEELPECAMKVEIGRALKAYLEDKPEAFRKAFDVVIAEGIPNTETETKTETECSARKKPRSKSSTEIWFKETFLPEYPRPIQIKSALATVRKLNFTPEECDAIMARLARLKQSSDWLKDDGKYIPGAHTFFSDGWYERDPQPSLNGKRTASMLTLEEWERKV